MGKEFGHTYLLGVEMMEVFPSLDLVGEADCHPLVVTRDVVDEHVPKPTGDLIVRKATEDAYLIGDLKIYRLFTEHKLGTTD